jgi:hypothetical protein
MLVLCCGSRQTLRSGRRVLLLMLFNGGQFADVRVCKAEL